MILIQKRVSKGCILENLREPLVVQIRKFLNKFMNEKILSQLDGRWLDNIEGSSPFLLGPRNLHIKILELLIQISTHHIVGMQSKL